ncbi:hypothetical protein [Nocardia wallacei]|uniref:hypothetical protein n=1 Tax=Nocardia wallacei TaxID=480035 RepID=UPI002458AD21|nr:hypothetical protein [Nocardia wallacei]
MEFASARRAGAAPAVRDAARHHATARDPAGIGLEFDAEPARLSLIRASSSLVRLELAEPVPARIQGVRRVAVRSVVTSTDDPDRLLAAVAEGRC